MFQLASRSFNAVGGGLIRIDKSLKCRLLKFFVRTSVEIQIEYLAQVDRGSRSPVYRRRGVDGSIREKMRINLGFDTTSGIADLILDSILASWSSVTRSTLFRRITSALPI